MLFQDSTHGVPDFWLEGSLEVYEISVCPHGVHLVFEVEERGNRHVAALTSPTPSPELVEERLGLDPSGRNGARRLAQYEARYVELRANIERVLDTSLGSGKQFDFRKRAAESRPIVEHGKGTLVLRWKGRSAELRGYLDVYFTLPT